MRVGIGPSVLISRITSEGEGLRLVSPAVALAISTGRRFRDVHGVTFDVFAHFGPSPTVTYEGETFQYEDASFVRGQIGLGYTRYLRPADGGFFSLSVGPGFADLDGEDVSSISVGGYGTLGLGREWAVGPGRVRVGLSTNMTFEAYRTIGEPERMRGVSLTALLTVSISPVGVGRHMPAPPSAPELAQTPPRATSSIASTTSSTTPPAELPVHRREESARERALRPSLMRGRRTRR